MKRWPTVSSGYSEKTPNEPWATDGTIVFTVPDAGTDREPWEYRVEVVKNPDVHALQDRLNRLGADGWELVSTVSTVKTWVNMTGNDLVYVFKRRGLGKFERRPEDEAGYVPF